MKNNILEGAYFFITLTSPVTTTAPITATQTDKAILNCTEKSRTVKSIAAREIFQRCPQVKKKLWGGEFWTDGFYASTVGQHGNEETIRKYVKEQGRENEYQQLLKQQLSFL